MKLLVYILVMAAFPVFATESLSSLLGQLSQLPNGPAAEICEQPASRPYCDNFRTFACPKTEQIAEDFPDRSNAYKKTVIELILGRSLTPAELESVSSGSMSFELQVLIQEKMQADPMVFMRAVKAGEDQLYQRIGVTREDLATQFGDIKNSVIATVSGGNYPPEIKARTIEKIRSLKLMDSSEFAKQVTALVRSKGEESPEVQAVMAFQGQCGLGLNFQAFVMDEINATYMCPGVLNAMVARLPVSKEAIRAQLSSLLGHESGHLLGFCVDSHNEELWDAADAAGDDREVTEVEHHIMACADRKYQLGLPVYDGLSTERVQHYFRNVQGEILPDIIGAESAADAIRRMNLPVEERARLMARAFSYICDPEGNETSMQYLTPGDHPSNAFRIEMIARNPKVREVLECPPPSEQQPACTVNGPVP